jgi:hypothetical protein
MIISLLDNKIIMRLERHADDPQKRWPKRLSITKVFNIFHSMLGSKNFR